MITIFDLTEEERRAFIRSVVHPEGTRARRRHVSARASVLRGDFDALMRPWVNEIYEDPEIIGQVLKHAFAIYNPLKRAANLLAVAYSRRPRRTLKGKVRPTKQLEAFLRKLRFDRRARHANRNGVALNTIVAMPLPRVLDDGDPTIEIRFCHGGNSEVLRHENSAKHSAPAVIGWLNTTNAQLLDKHGFPAITVADNMAWSTWDSRGDLVGEPMPHSLGVFPGVPLHLADDEEDEDWYDAFVNAEILEATKRVALVAASMDWTRKTQCRNLLTVTEAAESATGEDGEEQIIGDPENAWKLKGEGIAVQVQSFDQSVEPFLRHIRALSDEVLEIITGTISTIANPDPDKPLEGDAAARQHASLLKHQEEQLSEVDPYDERMVWMVTALGRELGMDVPDPSLVRDRLRTDYAPVPFIESQRSRLEFAVLATKYGVYDQVEWVREQTGLSEDEAIEFLVHMAERRAKIRVPLEEHNTPADPTKTPDPALPGESGPAQQGRTGGRTSPPSEAEAAR